MNKFVFKKVAELTANTELSEVKVDLALADDVKKAYAAAIAARKKSFDEMSALQKKVAEVQKTMQGLVKANQDALPMFDKFDAAAKALGLEVPKEILDQKQNIKDGLSGSLAMYTKNLGSIRLL
jgi:hypothetical protein